MYPLHNGEQKMFVEQFRRMADEKVAPCAAEINEKE